MKVTKNNIRNYYEELEYLRELLYKNGNFLVWEVHPSVIKTRAITQKRLIEKIKALVRDKAYDHPSMYYPIEIP